MTTGYTLRTLADLDRHRHGLGVWCWRCSRWQQIDLAAMVRDGRGDKAIAELKFRCRECGTVGSKTVQAVDVGVVSRYVGGGGVAKLTGIAADYSQRIEPQNRPYKNRATSD